MSASRGRADERAAQVPDAPNQAGAISSAADDLADAFCAGLREGGATFATYLPDSRLCGVEERLAREHGVTTVCCTREDEAVAVAIGASMAGARGVALMEGTGLGYCGLILARARLQHTPLLIVFSHPRGMGETLPHHATATAASHACLSGLDIPLAVPESIRRMGETVRCALDTVYGQRVTLAIGIPHYLPAG